MNLRRLEDTDLSLLLRELKMGETFASLLNIHGGDIRVVPTHLVVFVLSAVSLRFPRRNDFRFVFTPSCIFDVFPFDYCVIFLWYFLAIS